ncbi:MAG TPA: hypothetical protein VHT91_43860, partial [Kofleriaceae bacterium]|nr:hypothetical protein [Kofleriaceae bacterium]
MSVNLNHQAATIVDAPTDLDYHVDGQSVLTGTINQASSLTLWVNGQSFVKIDGSVPLLRIRLVDGQSKVRLEGLKAGEVTMLEKLDGQSILSVSTTGNFSFADKIDGNSWLLVDKVAPAVAGGLGAFRGKIDGKSRVDITVDNPNANYHVEFFDKIDGASTVELWNTWFTTTGRELSGSSTVSYTEASLPPHF